MLRPGEIVVDNFAGGGGASTGIEMAIGRSVDIAINHDLEAIAMHAANHPTTKHYCESVWDVDPVEACAGRPVGLAWFSPDCKHFSKAKGGKPVSKEIRGLAWVVVKWADLVKPRVIHLENVTEFQTWGPLVNDKPCPRRRGMTFKRWVTRLRNLGYAVEWQELAAKDYDTPTIRKRLFIVARRDGKPIVWPRPTNGSINRADLFSHGLKPYRTAAECIDWSIPCRSIFERDRPLKEATLRRIARGVMRFVVNDPEPFVVPVTHTSGGNVGRASSDPLATITTAKGGELAVVIPSLVEVGYGERQGQAPRAQDIVAPLGTVVASGKHALIMPVLAGCGGRAGQSPPKRADEPFNTVTAKADQILISTHVTKFRGGATGHDIREPLHTVTAGGDMRRDAGAAHALGIVSAFLTKFSENSVGARADEPLHTAMAGAPRHGVVAVHLDPALNDHREEVRSFLIKYYGTATGQSIKSPLHSITTKDRLGLVTVHGVDYAIVDIRMRMLTPRELYRAQGFPDSYIIDPIAQNGKRLNKTAQVRMCGNSVCPPVAAALVRANLGVGDAERRAA